jgi:hypothetical protein
MADSKRSCAFASAVGIAVFKFSRSFKSLIYALAKKQTCMLCDLSRIQIFALKDMDILAAKKKKFFGHWGGLLINF